jgi:hypothetical protein
MSAAREEIPAKDAEELRWMGFMGHRYVVLTDTAGRCEVNTLARAQAQAAEYGDVQNPRIYEQYRAAKWKRVRA